MVNNTPEQQAKIEQLKKHLKDNPPVTIDARKPIISSSGRIWMYAQFLGLTSFFAAFWLATFGIISPWAVPILFLLDFLLYIMFPRQ